jgi:hypothetical protein
MKSCYLNILETSTVALTAGAEDPSYPLYRIYDRDIGKIFKAQAAETLEIKVDQGAVPIAADRLIIPAGHNLAGMACDIKYSDDDVDYTPALPQWTGEDGLTIKSWQAIEKRYWKFIIAAPALPPQFAELFLTSTYEWERLPARPAGPFDDVFNSETQTTASGLDRFLVHGNPKKQRTYKVINAGPDQKTNILALNSAWQGAKPFWLCDHEGGWLYGKLRKPIELKEEGYNRFGFEFDFLEVLG